jgi:hypothetical protein
MQVTKFNTLIFIFQDGGIIEKHWEHKSRKETWRENLCQQQEQ